MPILVNTLVFSRIFRDSIPCILRQTPSRWVHMVLPCAEVSESQSLSTFCEYYLSCVFLRGNNVKRSVRKTQFRYLVLFRYISYFVYCWKWMEGFPSLSTKAFLILPVWQSLYMRTSLLKFFVFHLNPFHLAEPFFSFRAWFICENQWVLKLESNPLTIGYTSYTYYDSTEYIWIVR